MVTDPLYGKLFFLFLMLVLFWTTMVVSSPLAALLQQGMTRLGGPFAAFLSWSDAPEWLISCLVRGIGLPLAWALPYMLPPMAVFFPLLALAGETGLLPRAAFAMDRCLERCRACGRQCVSMAVGLGCSAAGVLSSRAIVSHGHRLTAILTCSLIPCSGKFPLLAALALLFFAGFPASGLTDGLTRALILTGAFLAALGVNLVLSRILSRILSGNRSPAFILELPEYRRPRFGRVILGSLFSRVLLVLGRMAAVALPAGMLIWISARIYCPGPAGGWFTFTAPAGRIPSLLDALIRLLAPAGGLMGLDGAILAAFLIGLPANEAVFPLILMIYLQAGSRNCRRFPQPVPGPSGLDLAHRPLPHDSLHVPLALPHHLPHHPPRDRLPPLDSRGRLAAHPGGPAALRLLKPPAVSCPLTGIRCLRTIIFRFFTVDFLDCFDIIFYNIERDSSIFTDNFQVVLMFYNGFS